MEIQFHIRGLNVNPGFRRRLEQPLEGLQSLISISAAAVVLDHRRDDPPAFPRVCVAGRARAGHPCRSSRPHARSGLAQSRHRPAQANRAAQIPAGRAGEKERPGARPGEPAAKRWSLRAEPQANRFMKKNKHNKQPDAGTQSQRVHFEFNYPAAESVFIAGTFNDWRRRRPP